MKNLENQKNIDLQAFQQLQKKVEKVEKENDSIIDVELAVEQHESNVVSAVGSFLGDDY